MGRREGTLIEIGSQLTASSQPSQSRYASEIDNTTSVAARVLLLGKKLGASKL